MLVVVLVVVVEGVVVVQRTREVMEGGDGGGGERGRQRRRGKGGGREAEDKHRSDVDVGRSWRIETVEVCKQEVLSSHQKQKRPTEQRRPDSFSLSCSLGTDVRTQEPTE